MRGIVFIGSGKISYGKLAQALDHGALTIQIAGDFDDAMERVQQVASRLGVYLVNSINPFRLEGQKTVMYRVLEALAWEPPDWIIVPGGNLGNSSAFGKAYMELRELGLVKKIPRLAVINAGGARTFDELVNKRGLTWNGGRFSRAAVNGYYAELDAAKSRANTIASAIEINRPVNLPKALRAIDVMNGVVRMASDQEIMDAKALVGAGGLGCEPASAASLAGLIQLREQGVIAPSDRVVCILTAHQMKDSAATVAYHSSDPDNFQQVLGVRGVKRASHANRAVQVPNELEAIVRSIELYS
jgi:threonine synthase